MLVQLWCVWKCTGSRHWDIQTGFAQVQERQVGGWQRWSRWHNTTADIYSLCKSFSCLQHQNQWSFPSPLLLYSPSFHITIAYRLTGQIYSGIGILLAHSQGHLKDNTIFSTAEHVLPLISKRQSQAGNTREKKHRKCVQLPGALRVRTFQAVQDP